MLKKNSQTQNIQSLKKSPCRNKGPAVCRSLSMCKYVSGKKRNFCRSAKSRSLKASNSNNNRQNNNRQNNNAINMNLKLKQNKMSFAQHLAAFILESHPRSKKIVFDKKNAFSTKQGAVAGVLPFLHMNVSEREFVNMLNNGLDSLHQSLNGSCNAKDLNNVLRSVGFNCKNQTGLGVNAVNASILASIKNRYAMRKVGQENLREILCYMTWQNQNGMIPASSLKWSK